MSLVGPRPTVASQVERYDARQRRRLLARPGLTGLAQVSGRNAIPWSERIEIDLAYVDAWSPRGDLAILARTASVVLRRGGTYVGERGGFDLSGRGRPMADVTVLLTCAGQRVDIVRAFREALDGTGHDGRVLVSDLDPLSPSLFAADGAVEPAPGLRPGLRRRRRRACRREGCGRCCR